MEDGMNYNKSIIKDGITFHKIATSKFKTNLFAIFITTPLSRETVTKNALISAVLRRGTKNMPTQDAIAKELKIATTKDEVCTGSDLDFYIDDNEKFDNYVKDKTVFARCSVIGKNPSLCPKY